MIKRVFRLHLDYEKEEIWLNKMAQQGWMMKSFFLGLYQFVRETPGEYIYRVEMLPHRVSSPKNQSYLQFLQDMNVEIITAWVVWVIYRRKAEDGPFDVYSDIDSRIAHYGRISRFLLPFGLFQLIMAVLQGYSLFIVLFDHTNENPILPIVLILLMAACFAFVILGTSLRFRKKRLRLVKEKLVLESID